MSAHTPGPWEVNYVVDGAFEIQAARDGDPIVIATRAPFRKRHLEFVDNARLIAAAPDLLAACVEAYEWIVRHGDSVPASAVPLSMQLRAAIAKAEGSAVSA